MDSPAPDCTLSPVEHAGLQTERHAIAIDDAVFRVEGRGAIDCLQGLLTNDVAKAANHTAVWGAFLTPKGMIIADAWTLRDGDAAWVLVPEQAQVTMAQLFSRTVPPRLATIVDRTGSVAVRWLRGSHAPALSSATVFRPAGPAPFTAIAVGDDPVTIDAELAADGSTNAPAKWATAARLLMGWPALGREIDDRTLPQEVRFDELGGVRYDKGCYTGQETVARLHFRGHANRVLRGVVFGGTALPADRMATHDGKPVGTVRTIGRIADRTIALAVLRREVTVGDVVQVGGEAAQVVELPFEGIERIVA
jgi:folate-binding protein YgfZ